MKKANLIDIFGLSGDPASDDQVEELLARLESEQPINLVDANPEGDHLSGIFNSWQLDTTSSVESFYTH